MPSESVQFIICGIHRNEEGLWFCPYCGYTSDDIEMFATSMCWDCAFPGEDKDELPAQAG